ncbi:MAG: hypothetical protein R3B49_09375 [Phycisphaerales bacterium]
MPRRSSGWPGPADADAVNGPFRDSVELFRDEPGSARDPAGRGDQKASDKLDELIAKWAETKSR